MDSVSFVPPLVSFLAPFLGHLLKQKKYEGTTGDHDLPAWETAKALWSKLGHRIKQRTALQAALQDAADAPYDDDALGSLRLQLKKLLSHDETLAKELKGIWEESLPEADKERTAGVSGNMPWRDSLDRHDEVLRRIEMIRLLRSGMLPEHIAGQFNTDTEYLHRLNAAFSLSGPIGVLSAEPRTWLDSLGKDDPILRRLEIIRLVRSGTPPFVVAREYDAVTEYIQRIQDRFSQHGVVGILTEEDFQKFRALHPKVIRICSFNLQGTQKNDRYRLKRIAREMSALDPALCAFQEVISGRGIPETSGEIAKWMTRMTGSHYRTHFGYCHLFKEKYPEGVSVSSHYPLRNVQVIDLNKGLGRGLHPLMERFAAAAEIEIYGKRIVFVSVHLDHAENREIRRAQAEKLLMELKRHYKEKDHSWYILAGDFNDVEDSPVVHFLKKEGYTDTYRHCNSGRGNTFTSSNPHMRIDYIMVKGYAHIESAEVILGDPELSDHRGVSAVLALKQ
jgi:maltose 6'-phosphate phosphatase